MVKGLAPLCEACSNHTCHYGADILSEEQCPAHRFPDSGRNFCLEVNERLWPNLHTYSVCDSSCKVTQLFCLVLYLCYQELKGMKAQQLSLLCIEIYFKDSL